MLLGSFLFLLLLDFYAFELDGLLLVLQMEPRLFVLLDILFAIGEIYPAVLAPFLACHALIK